MIYVRNESYEKKIASLLRNKEIFYTLYKLSEKNVINLEDLEQWYNENFNTHKNYDNLSCIKDDPDI